MKIGANIAAPDDPAVWQTAAETYKVSGGSFISCDYSNSFIWNIPVAKHDCGQGKTGLIERARKREESDGSSANSNTRRKEKIGREGMPVCRYSRSGVVRTGAHSWGNSFIWNIPVAKHDCGQGKT